MSVLFSYAFRPLFLLATLHAVLIVPYWVAAWLGAHSLPISSGGPTGWHAHEMVYGFAGAAIGGFALTAVATWTQRPPVAGRPLVALSLLWVSARVLFTIPFPRLFPAAVVADLAYGLLLFILMSREVISARNRRNYKVLVILALLPVTNAIYFFAVERAGASWSMTSLLAGLWLVVWLVNLVAGRIIPAFTRNWLKRQAQMRGLEPKSLPPMFDRFDLLTTCLLVIFGVLQVLDAPPGLSAAIGVVTGLLFVVRLSRWQGRRTAREPLVWVLHLAFAWIPIGVLLLSAAELGVAPRTAGIHALGTGAIGTMIVAVASRAALGHTNRPLEGHTILTTAYLLITAAGVFRVAATVGPAARAFLVLSAAAWTLGFVCFAWRYVPILTRPAASRSLPIA